MSRVYVFTEVSPVEAPVHILVEHEEVVFGYVEEPPESLDEAFLDLFYLDDVFDIGYQIMVVGGAFRT